MALFTTVEKKVIELLKIKNSISEERKEILNNFKNYISDKLKDDKTINLVFICTHNSRRSTMAQIWAQTAAEYFGIKNVQSYSGGTEATAFNPRAVKAVEDAGFRVEKINKNDNPKYHVSYSDSEEPIVCFSKVFGDSFNPQKDFAAIMTCSDADANCPIVLGAEARFPIKYNDPKEFDGTELEKEKYRERFYQIGIEMLFVFGNVKKKIIKNQNE